MANSPGSSSFTRAYDALGTRLALDPRTRRSSAAAQRGRRPLRAARRHANTSNATAAIAAAGKNIFISWRMGECKDEVKALKAALETHGVKVIVIGELPGADLLQTASV